MASLLRRRAAQAGADPLLTYYEPAVGTRVELSATTLLNWVDKTSHLLDELDVTAGDAVGLALAEAAPGHWVTSVWELACWQVGVTVVVGPPTPTAVALLVTGPDWAPYADAGPDVVACSLHPLGLPLGGRLPPGVLDYALEVRGQADRYGPVPQPGTAPAWVDPERRLTQADLAEDLPERDLPGDNPPRGRRLIRPTTPWPTARAAVVAPLLTGGSAVVVAGPVGTDELVRISDQERAAP